MYGRVVILLCLLGVAATTGCGRLGYQLLSGPDGDPDASVGPDGAGADDGSTGPTGAVIQVAAGGEHTCVLFESGAVRCWGLGANAQLGNGTRRNIGDEESAEAAVDVDLGGNATAIETGERHTCAILDGGRVRCWGHNGSGRLGYGHRSTIGIDETPREAGDVNLGGAAVQLALGDEHTCARLDTGGVRCWGRSNSGQLGYGNEDSVGDDETPADAGDVDLGGRAVWISAADATTCAVLDTGAAYCWGENNDGRLGYGNTQDVGDDETPASVGPIDLGGLATRVATGASFACALLDTGRVRCWGRASDGRLGNMDGTSIGDDEPASMSPLVDLGGTTVELDAGPVHTCARLTTGNVHCWGTGARGRLGYGNESNVGDTETPASVGPVPIGGSAAQVDVGENYACVLLTTGTVRCWGEAGLGQLGYGVGTETIGDDDLPTSVAPLSFGAAIVQVSAGAEHTCALLAGGAVQCWGHNTSGQLGYGHTRRVGETDPHNAGGNVMLAGPAVEVAAGGSHTCARLDSGNVQCWGRNEFGQLGYGDTIFIGNTELPTAVGAVDLGGSAIRIVAGVHHSCALLSGGTVRCWGRSEFGQLGYGNVNAIGDDETPASVPAVDVGGTAVELVAGGYHTCARLDTGAVRCWGRGEYGAPGQGAENDVGDDETPASVPPIDVGGTVVELTAGFFHTCARLDSGAVRCWGRNAEGALGYGNTSSIGDNESPSSAGDVDLGGAAVELTAGSRHTCARLDTGAVRCWGLGIDGRLGYGNTATIGDTEAPRTAGDVPLGALATQISAGATHVCAVLSGGTTMRCWGTGDFGQIGLGRINHLGDDELPTAVGPVPLGM